MLFDGVVFGVCFFLMVVFGVCCFCIGCVLLFVAIAFICLLLLVLLCGCGVVCYRLFFVVVARC